MDLAQIEPAPFFGDVVLRVGIGAEKPVNGIMSAADAMNLSRQLAKAAKAAGYVKPAKGAAGA